MIKMQADYNHPDMTYHPSTDELNTTLTKFSKNILESSKKFGRWWDGFCRIFEESIDKETSEKTIRYTFYTEINKNPVIRMLSYDIVKMSKDIVDKFDLYKERYVNNSAKRLFDKNELSKMNK